jgi:hypothetical protein
METKVMIISVITHCNHGEFTLYEPEDNNKKTEGKES